MVTQLTIYINYAIGYIHLDICTADSFFMVSRWRTIRFMSFLNIKDREERNKMIIGNLALKEKIMKDYLEENNAVIDYQGD